MLRLILGRAGSGKTHLALDTAIKIASSGKDVVFVVPEQFTFETERTLLESLGPSMCLHAEVLSFSRMATRVFELYGGRSGRAIDDCGRLLLMNRAVKQVRDMLKVYRSQAESIAFSKKMVDTLSEFKYRGISAADLLDVGRRAKDEALNFKLMDLSLLLQTYDAMSSTLFMDSLDDLTRLSEKLEKHLFFQNKIVIIDAFKGFTSPQKEVIAHILQQSQDVYIALCVDGVRQNADEMGLFSPVRKTARELIQMANHLGQQVASPILLKEQYRFSSSDLAALEKNIFRVKHVCTEEIKNIHLISAENVYEESQFVAQEISRLVQKENARYKDIVVISRGLSLYNGILDPICKKYGIPLFLDAQRDLTSHPLMAFFLDALDAITTDFRQEVVLRMLKTGLAGITSVEIAELENYLYTWNYQGIEAWNNEWTEHPDGIGKEKSERSQRHLKGLNRLRERVLMPLKQLSCALETAESGSQKVLALYNFLLSMRAEEQMTQMCTNLTRRGEVELADEYRQVWEKMIAFLEQAFTALGDAPISLREFAQVMRLGVSALHLAHIPPTLDQVTAGEAERIRAGNAKYVFIIGLSEGVFPQTNEAGILTERERRTLLQLGVELAPSAEEALMEERFIAYQAFCCASNTLYLSYPKSDLLGKSIQPSPYLSELQTVFPYLKIKNTTDVAILETVWNKSTAFEGFASTYQAKNNFYQAMEGYFDHDERYAFQVEGLKRASIKKPAHIDSSSYSRTLFGEQMYISPSRLEVFEQCRFLYFCRYGIKAYPRNKAELQAPQVGQLIHFVLENILKMHSGNKLSTVSEKQIRLELENLVVEYANRFLGGLENKPARFQQLYLRLKETVMRLVVQLAKELSQSDFVPADFELKIASDGQIPPVVLELEDGGSIAVEGQVDRVDVLRRDGKTYLRVVDYKTGLKDFSLADIIYGLNLQMFVYLFTLCDQAEEHYNAKELVPAGVLYFPAKQPEIQASHGDGLSKISQKIDGQFKMKGLISDDPDVICGMEHDAKGVFIPVQFKKGTKEPDARSAIASLEQFGLIRHYLEKLLREMASTLRMGDIAAIPVTGRAYHPCDYCDYQSVCGFENGDPKRWLNSLKKDEIWKMLKGKDENV